jgi:predicted nucleic acid-binding Zn ribbon protein
MSEYFITKICPVCGKIFESRKCFNRTTCSRKCKYKNHSRLLSQKIDKKCIVCNESFLVSPADRGRKYCSVKCFRIDHKAKKKPCMNCGKLISLDKTTCSKECMAKYYKVFLCGENNPNWRGGSDRRINSGIGLILREKILARDEFTCQDCGQNLKEDSRFLHIHHVLEVSKGGKSVESNLITLCFVCHWIGKHKYEFNEIMREIATQKGCGLKYLIP